MKECVGCRIFKHRDEFGADARHADGLFSRCRECERIRVRAWKAARRDAIRDEAAQ